MNEDKQHTIHFNNGTKMEISFPTQIKNSTGAFLEGIKERIFDLQIIDRQSQAVVWSDFSRNKTATTLPENVVRQLVARMLAPFPPGTKTGVH
jgi:hypothetical protein